jgi:hypothetical protein
MGSVSAHLAGAYTTTLHMMVNRVKEGGRAPPPSPAKADFFHHDGMYAINRQLPFCVYSMPVTVYSPDFLPVLLPISFHVPVHVIPKPFAPFWSCFGPISFPISSFSFQCNHSWLRHLKKSHCSVSNSL